MIQSNAEDLGKKCGVNLSENMFDFIKNNVHCEMVKSTVQSEYPNVISRLKEIRRKIYLIKKENSTIENENVIKGQIREVSVWQHCSI